MAIPIMRCGFVFVFYFFFADLPIAIFCFESFLHFHLQPWTDGRTLPGHRVVEVTTGTHDRVHEIRLHPAAGPQPSG